MIVIASSQHTWNSRLSVFRPSPLFVALAVSHLDELTPHFREGWQYQKHCQTDFNNPFRARELYNNTLASRSDWYQLFCSIGNVASEKTKSALRAVFEESNVRLIGRKIFPPAINGCASLYLDLFMASSTN